MSDIVVGGRTSGPRRPAPTEAGDGPGSRLRESCRQMEGLFLHQMLKAMDQQTWGEGLFGGSSAGRVFRARRNAALAEELGRREALGLSDVLYRELAEQVEGAGRAEAQESE